MRFIFDISTGVLSYQINTPPVFVYGNTARRIDVQLRFDGSPYFLQSGQALYMALRAPNDFSEAPLADLSVFSLTSGSESVYTGYLNLFTTQLQEFLAESNSGDILYQFTLTTDPDETQSSEAKSAIVQNYTANPLSGTPTPLTGPGAVLYTEDQGLTVDEQVVGQGNVGITWDANDGVFVIQTPDGPRYVSASS